MYRIVLLTVLAGVCALPPAFAEPPEPDDELRLAPLPATSPVPAAEPALPVDLKTALEWTLSRNPELLAIRQNAGVSRAALAVAQRFPTSVNPTVAVDVRPWTFEKNTGQGAKALETQVSVTWAQPIELGGRTGFRTEIAQAAFTQTQWNILQAELAALVQTYRLHQTALYRHEKLRVAQQLADFNRQLVKTVERQMQANQVSPADVALAEIESQSTDQQQEVAWQEYIGALTELRQQIGVGEYMGCLEPSGPLQLPDAAPAQDEENLIRNALESRPEVHAARAQVAGSRAAVCLARADRIPIPSLGPVYEKDESGTTFYGLAVSTPIPLLNAGRTLVSQREAEYHRDCVVLEQTQRKIGNQVKAALLKWHQAQQLVHRTQTMMEPIKAQANRVDKLYAAGQSDLVKLLQVRQRLIQAENTQLDALWQATQAYAEMLTALGTTPLVGSLHAESNAPAPLPAR